MPTSLTRRPLGRGRATVISIAAFVPALALVAGPGALPAGAAPGDDPVLSLVVPEKVVAHGNGTRLWEDLGIGLQNDGGDMTLLLQRGADSIDEGDSRYDEPVTASVRTGDAHETTSPTRALDGVTATMDGLEGLGVHLAFTPVGRNRGKAFTLDPRGTCLGGEGSQRIGRDGPATSPYPQYCYGTNPFALGNVQGIPSQWYSPLVRPYAGLRVPPGTWDVDVSIQDPAVADALAIIDPEQSMRLKVIGTRGHGRNPGRQGAPEGSPGIPMAPALKAPSDGPSGEPLPAGTPAPDLQSLPAFGMRIPKNGNFLQFSATVWNAGDSPLVVDGFNPDGDELMDGYQYFFNSDGQQVTYRPVGQFEWDPKPTHLHWHFRAFAQYSLVPHGEEVDPGNPDEHHVKSRKEAFCLANTDAVDLTGTDAAWNVDNSDLSTACGERSSRSIREVLAAGWGDTYAQFRAGQSFSLKGLANGCYDIVVEGNPERAFDDGVRRTLYETDYENNVATRVVKLGGKPGARTVKWESVGDIQDGGTTFSCPDDHEH